MIRKIVHIDADLCNGCGACANACHEDAIAMIDGKAKLIKDDYCDGLGDCLPACPTNAIAIIEREAEEYDEAAVKERMEAKHSQAVQTEAMHGHAGHGADGHHGHGGGCPGSRTREFQRQETMAVPQASSPVANKSQLKQWPVQIKLVPVNAAYFENANLLIAADCTAYAYAGFHEDFIKNHITLIGCPKLDEGSYAEKLGMIIKNNNIKSVKIVRMEVPCCGGLEYAVIEAMKSSGKMIPWQVVTITFDGKIKED
jgi:NAD-dependent dihydropyrimidine dehydrogenase PreA subunit